MAKENLPWYDEDFERIYNDALNQLSEIKPTRMVVNIPSYGGLVEEYVAKHGVDNISPQDLRRFLKDRGVEITFNEARKVADSIAAHYSEKGGRAKGYSTVDFYYDAMDPFGGVGYVIESQGREVGDSFQYRRKGEGVWQVMRVSVWHYVSLEPEDIASDIALFFLDLRDRQYERVPPITVVYRGLTVQAVYRFVYKFESVARVEEMVEDILDKEPLLSKNEVIARLKAKGVRVNAAVVGKKIGEYRRKFRRDVEKYLEKLVTKYMLRHKGEKVKIEDVYNYIRSKGYVVPREFGRVVTNTFMKYSIQREEYMRKILDRLYKRNMSKINSVNALVKLYRSKGYKGTDAVLRKVAKQVMGR
jgi:hypothetical protein